MQHRIKAQDLTTAEERAAGIEIRALDLPWPPPAGGSITASVRGAARSFEFGETEPSAPWRSDALRQAREWARMRAAPRGSSLRHRLDDWERRTGKQRLRLPGEPWRPEHATWAPPQNKRGTEK